MSELIFNRINLIYNVNTVTNDALRSD